LSCPQATVKIWSRRPVLSRLFNKILLLIRFHRPFFEKSKAQSFEVPFPSRQKTFVQLPPFLSLRALPPNSQSFDRDPLSHSIAEVFPFPFEMLRKERFQPPSPPFLPFACAKPGLFPGSSLGHNHGTFHCSFFFRSNPVDG